MYFFSKLTISDEGQAEKLFWSVSVRDGISNGSRLRRKKLDIEWEKISRVQTFDL